MSSALTATNTSSSVSGASKLLDILGLNPMTLAQKDLERGSNPSSDEEYPKPEDPSSAENSDDDKDGNSDAEEILPR